MKDLWLKIKESIFSIVPVVAIVVILSFTPLLNLSAVEIGAFLISSVFLIVGMGLFNLGADFAMSPMGDHIGSGLTKSKNLFLLVSVSFAMGMLITVAEPDLTVLADQVGSAINETLLIFTVGAGVGLFLLLAVLKIVFKWPLSGMLLFFYLLLFAFVSILILNGGRGFLSVAFDSGGVTTGPVTVPFIMALGVGIAATVSGGGSGENSFGLIALCSIGPIVAVSLLGIGGVDKINYEVPDYSIGAHLNANFFPTLLTIAKDVAFALLLIVAFFIVLQIFVLKLPFKKLKQIGLGIIFTYTGLVMFLLAVNVGFVPVGYKMGVQLSEYPAFIVIFGFVLGAVTVLAEPAIHVLNRQVEEVTGGTVKKRSMMIALSAGVGIAIALSVIRMIFNFSILYYVVPGYLISLGLSFFVPRIYTAIAFDSGGVASGPLTSGFILPFAIGACVTLQGGGDGVLEFAFGIVATVAMAPLIAIQLLGFRAIAARRMRSRIAMKRILNADDEQIIYFE